jgi:hypothetical protein
VVGQGSGRGLSGNGDEIVRLFDYWAKQMGHPRAKLDRKRRTRIQARLREGLTPRDLAKAILGARLDPFLMGDDPRAGRRYDGIETIFRDRAQVERLVELYEHRADSKQKRTAPVDQAALRRRASVAWNEVQEAVRRVGAYRSPPRFQDLLTSNIVARWGWRNICLGDAVSDRIRFCDAYQEMARRENRDD